MKILKFRWKLLLIPSLVFLLLFTMYKLPNTFGTFLAGIILYLILNPVVDIFNKKIRPRFFCAAIVFILFFILLALFGSLVNYIGTTELPKFTSQIPSFISTVRELLKNFDSKLVLLNKLSAGQFNNFSSTLFNSIFSSNLINEFFSNARQALFTIMTISFDFIMAVVIAFYLVIDEQRILQFIEKTLPKRIISINREMWKEMMRCMSGYVAGLILLGIILFISSYIGLIYLKVQYAFLLSLWIGATIIIPYIGPFIGTLPALIVAFSQTMFTGVAATIYFILVQFIVTSIIGPKILGEIIGIHPIIVILTLIAGGELGGIAGMIIAVPLTSIFLIFVKYYWSMFVEA